MSKCTKCQQEMIEIFDHYGSNGGLQRISTNMEQCENKKCKDYGINKQKED